MGYYKARTNRKARKETTAQSLARYKRQQRQGRMKQEAHRLARLENVKPGGILNPMTPTWCSFEKYETIRLSSRQMRYRGCTEWTSYLKGTEPTEYSCAMTGHKKRTELTREQWVSHMNTVSNVMFGKCWYRHPITAVSYEEFCERYVVFEEHQKYLD